jgi:hypothetical protein
LLEIGINETFQGREETFVFLPHPRQAQRTSFLGDEFRRDARAFAPSNAKLPPRSAAFPFVVKPAALAERRAQGDEPTLRHGEHGPNAAIQVVRNAGGLVEYEQIHTAERANGALASGQAENARTVDQLQPQLRLMPRSQRLAERLVGIEYLAKNLAALPLRRRQKQHQSAGREQGGVQSQGADDGGFATLSAAIE